MALVLADRVQETTTSTGTGTITLAGAALGYQSFSTAIGNGNTTYYTISGGSEWEVGIGTYTSAGNTLSRDTVLSSSAGGTTKVTFSAGIKNVFVTYPAEKSVNEDASGNVGIGTTAPVDKLQVEGNLYFGTSNRVVYSGGSANLTLQTSTGVLAFNTGGSVERMRINAAGNVGIGTSSPDASGKLTLAGTGGAAGITLNRTNTGVGGAQGFVGFKSVNGYFTAAISNVTSGNDDTASLIFRTAASSTAPSPYSVTERMRIDSSGNVGIGTASPNGKLHVAGTTASLLVDYLGDNYHYAGTHYFNNAANTATAYLIPGTSSSILSTNAAVPLAFGTNNSERMRIDSSGNVGIGTTSPQYKLDVTGGGALGAIRSYDSGTAGVDTRIILGSSGNGASGRGVAISFQPSGSANSVEAVKLVGLQETTSSTANNASFAVQVANTSGTLTERMRIDSSGNVGIGTSSPGAKLNVQQAVTGSVTSLLLSRTTGNVGDEQSIVWQQNDLSNLQAASIAAGVDSATSGSLRFKTASGSVNTERMRIDSSGNLLVGTTSANTSKLRVSAADGTYPLGVSGTTKGLRVVTNATDLRLDAVDNTLAASYEPLFLNGSIVKLGTSLTERMRIDSSGYVGIGTSSPGGKFAVVTGSSAGTSLTTWDNYAVFGPNAGSSTGSALGLSYNTASNTAEIAAAQPGTQWRAINILSQDVRFTTNGTERLRIASNGAWGLAGANYGTSGQVLTSNGSGSAPTWQTPAMTQARATALSMILGF